MTAIHVHAPAALPAAGAAGPPPAQHPASGQQRGIELRLQRPAQHRWQAGAPIPDEVLTLNEVAALPKLAENTVYALANAGEIPAFKIGGQWRTKQTELDKWIDAQPCVREEARDGE